MKPKPRRRQVQTAIKNKTLQALRADRASEQLYAVLTGDIVASSALPPEDLKRTMNRLRNAAMEFSKAFPEAILGSLDVFSGDGWQLLLANSRQAMRLALFLRARLKTGPNVVADTRVSVGIGTIDHSNLNLKKLSESTGSAFERSGRALRSLPKAFAMSWAGPDIEPEQPLGRNRLLQSSLFLLDELVARWTPKQAHSVALSLLGKNQYQIAEELGVSQPAVSTSLSGAGWKGIENYLAALENNPK